MIYLLIYMQFKKCLFGISSLPKFVIIIQLNWIIQDLRMSSVCPPQLIYELDEIQ